MLDARRRGLALLALHAGGAASAVREPARVMKTGKTRYSILDISECAACSLSYLLIPCVTDAAGRCSRR